MSNSDEYYVCGDTARVALWYPRLEGYHQYIKVELVDVRAADGIRIHYDFERDGWVIEQDRTPVGEERTWTEVAFAPADGTGGEGQ